MHAMDGFKMVNYRCEYLSIERQASACKVFISEALLYLRQPECHSASFL